MARPGYEALEAAGVVAVVRGESAAAAVEVSTALADAGVRAIEVAFTTPGAPEALAALAERLGDRAAIGAGTVLDAAGARIAVDAGAAFLVSPGYAADVVDVGLDAGRAVLPGVLTPTEIMAATGRGLRALKLFPGSLGGPAYLRYLEGPFPDVRFMPTGGVSAEDVPAWLDAGAFAVGLGGRLAPKRIRDAEHRAAVVDMARRVVERVASHRAVAA